MASILFGFATALVYGFADFFGAIASKKIRSVTVTFFSAIAGLIFLASIAPLLQTRFNPESILWGIAAGLVSAVAMNALYGALALGPISIVSPLSAVLSAVVPALVGLTHGESFSGWGYLALVAILVAVVLVGFIPGDAVRLPSGKALGLALIAGTGIGLVMVCLSAAPHNSGIATVVVLRSVSSLVLGIVTLISFRRLPNPGELKTSTTIWISIMLAGIFDSSANVFFTLGARAGSLTVVSVLEALYPLGTIVLARVVLKEKIAPVQLAGIFLALAASGLLAFKP